MDLFEALHTRRSIRKFDPNKQVSDEDLNKILGAAMIAPSAGNAQPWHFVVVTDLVLKEELSRIHPYIGMLRDAPMGIVVCAELALEKYPGYWVQDLAAAVQNLLLAARGLGLGTVWTGVCPIQERMDAVRRILQLPAGIEPHAVVPLGWPLQEFKLQDRFKEERVHRNGW
ncbi:Nitroreductase [Desulfonatronum thiosulfatophilum]|uniref:Nitroreductase n=1 Tax=Desulfonatronum thiosulfatophilum TaxID=617002 RepID=A0A1G6A8P3_9BACT|nr:nitroreductase family protein [Desulfonatronum thiosulfatophilum]SDB04781.1 Nitroreductase [Desulfonatronum thiosulfatophilum]